MKLSAKKWLSLVVIVLVLAVAYFYGGTGTSTSNKTTETTADQTISDTTASKLDESDDNPTPDQAQQELTQSNDSIPSDAEAAGTTGDDSQSGTAANSESSPDSNVEKGTEEPVAPQVTADKPAQQTAGTKSPSTTKPQGSNSQGTTAAPNNSDTNKSSTPSKNVDKGADDQPSKSSTGSKDSGKDKYLTEQVPAGKPTPVEPQDADVDKKKSYTVTLSVMCKTILDHMDQFNKDKLEVLPEDGVIFPATKVTFYEGESVFDVLLREMKKAKIHMEFEMTPLYNSNYIEGINNIYEFDCGELSGWMYRVNGWFPNYGASRYQLKDGDVIEWLYTCDLGRDIGGGQASTGGAE